jgi:hypothetical protein
MSPGFGKGKRDKGVTIALLDIENGSVGAALARLAPQSAPRLFGEVRIETPVLSTLDTLVMSRNAERAAREALRHVSEVAARLRLNENVSSIGEVGRAVAFLSPPWAAMHLSGGTADYAPHMQETVQGLLTEAFGDARATLHPFGTAVAHGAVRIFPEVTPALVCIVHADVTEVLAIADNRLVGRATIPTGLHTLMRTLAAHGGLSSAEAQSLLALGSHAQHTAVREPLAAAREHFAREFAGVAQDLLAQMPSAHVLVLAPRGAEEWFARALAEDTPLKEIFPEDSTVRAMHAPHLMPHIAAHAPRPDVPLMLEALFVDAKFSGIY